MSLIAKPVIDKQFWILQDNNEKIGNVEACDGGYQVKINNQVIAQFKTIRMLERNIDVLFEPAHKKTQVKNSGSVYGYDAAGRVFNPMWNVQQKLPVYTKTKKSKSWYAAGWYAVKKGRRWTTMQDPKLILLQRYKYKGPFNTNQEALSI